MIKQLLFTERKAMIKNIQKKMGVLSAERNYKPVHLLLMFFSGRMGVGGNSWIYDRRNDCQ